MYACVGVMTERRVNVYRSFDLRTRTRTDQELNTRRIHTLTVERRCLKASNVFYIMNSDACEEDFKSNKKTLTVLKSFCAESRLKRRELLIKHQ